VWIDGLLRCTRNDGDGTEADHTAKTGKLHNQKPQRDPASIRHPYPPIRNQNHQATPAHFFVGRPGIAVRMTYFRRTENIHLGSTGVVD
jgi:hypothetical protein